MGWSGQFKDKETGEEVILPFSKLQDLIDIKIEDICNQVGGDEPPILFLTESEEIVRMANQWPDNNYTYTPGFRYSVAQAKPYKGTRSSPKPFHFYNIVAYLLADYDTRISQDGLEADDMLAIEQCKPGSDTIICSRDKDLRQVPGWHYSWECGKQREVGPTFTDPIGWLEKNDKGKVIGYGLKFFYFQMLVGDSVDNIPGCPGVGEVKAFKLIDPLKCETAMKLVCIDEYKKAGKGKDYWDEQKGLLWMMRSEQS